MYSWTELQRASLINEDTGQVREFLINPEELTTKIEVEWNRAAALGGSSQRLSYQHTNNMKFDLTLRYNRIVYAERRRVGSSASEQLRAAKDFEGNRLYLMSLCYPRGRTTDILRRSPPPCLLLWPNYLAVRVVVTSLDITDKLFATNGAPIMFEAKLGLEEHRTYRLVSREVMAGALLSAPHSGAR